MHQRPRNYRRIAVICFFLLLASLLQAQSSADDAFRRAVQFHQAGDYEKAIQAYRECLSLDPGNFQARSNLGAALSHEGRYDEAIEQYRQALAAAPAQTAPSLHLNLALAYYKSGRIAEAAAELESQHAVIPATNPHAKQITMLLADCDLRLGRPRKVVQLLDAMADADPNDQARNYMLGVALIRDGQVNRGQEVIDRILKNGNSAEAHFLLGSQMFQSSDFPGAVKEFQKAIDLNPKLPSLESYYGQALLNTGDPDAAAEAFRNALAADPNDYEANLLTGEILNQRRKNSEAIPYLERATLVRPDSPEARRELALARNPTLAQKSEGSQSPAGGPATGTLAPDFALPRLGSSKSIRLADYRGKRPVLLVFGSYTCPFFRSAAPKINSLYEKYGGRLPFLL
ncbi:MAG: tetratricopeptide repeat protein, partial [Bryobacteraceae bacterium]